MALPVVHGADAFVASVSTLRSPPRPGSGTMEVVRLQRMRSMSQESLPDGVMEDVAQDSMDMSRLAIDDDPFASLDVPVDNHPLPAVVSSAIAGGAGGVTNMSKSNRNDDEDDEWGSFGVAHVAVPASTSPPNRAGGEVLLPMFIASGGASAAAVGSSPMDAEWTSVTSAGPPPSLTSASASVTTSVCFAQSSIGSDDWIVFSRLRRT
jgi:hypothetical protein